MENISELFTEMDIDEMESGVLYGKIMLMINNPVWIRAFDFYNKHNNPVFKMNCRPCYAKVLQYIVNRKFDELENSGLDKPFFETHG